MARSKVKPITEQLLTDLQEEYLKTRDIVVYQQIFSEILPYARSLILKKNTGKIWLSPDLVDSAALETTVKFMSLYQNPDFKINASFAGILGFKLLEALYGPKVVAADQISSLNEHIESEKSKETELGDMQEAFNFTYMFRPDNAQIGEDPANYLFNKESDVIQSIMSVFKDLHTSVSLHTYFLICIGALQFIMKTKTYNKYIELYLSDKLKELLDVTLLEVRNRLIGVV
jgi:hypothetical protein